MLETQESFGGTWITHRYPGIRSDSDLYTFGYRFKPWTGKPIATAEEILDYMGEVIEENDLARHIRYRHRIAAAKWSSTDNRWTIGGVRLDTGEPFRITVQVTSDEKVDNLPWPAIDNLAPFQVAKEAGNSRSSQTQIVNGKASQRNLYVTQFTFTPVPGPASVALLGLAALIAGPRRRRA